MASTRVTRHVHAPRAAVYQALLDPVAVARWKVPDGMTCQVHAFDAREGGSFRISLTYDDPTRTGKTAARTDTYHGTFLKLVPDELVVEGVEFETDDPSLRGKMTVTTALREATGGTEVEILHEGVPVGVSPADNELGTRMALAKLGVVVEADGERRAHADRIIGLYEDHALSFDADRNRRLFERPWLDRFLDSLPPSASVLDLGCGMGEPMARYLIEHGCRATGVDAAPTMIRLCKERFPSHEWLIDDMRCLDLGRKFHGLLAWDSFFHLEPDHQRRMFAVFERHAGPSAMLMFTSGDRASDAIGAYCGEPLYHASLAPEKYRSLLEAHGFEVAEYVANDPSCGHHTVWLARRRLEP